MSAYQVSTDTIDLMVSVLVEWGSGQRLHPWLYSYGDQPTEPELTERLQVGTGFCMFENNYNTADALGRELIAANIRSLTARYSDGLTMVGYFPDDYTWRRVTADQATIAQAMGAAKCYRYQACEYNGWNVSFANELVNRCLDRLVDIVSGNCWDYERPATSGTVVSIFDLVGEA